MAEYTNNEGQGSLFVNDKGGNDRRPDFKGSIMIGDKKYWLSAWKRQSQNGTPYMSLMAQPADAQAAKTEDMPDFSNNKTDVFSL